MVAVAEDMRWVLEELELKQALPFSFGLGICKNAVNSGHLVPSQRTQAARANSSIGGKLYLFHLC